jgi:rhodanese-related sulfurtransferase
MRRVSPREAHALMEQQGYVYLDVRSVPEFDLGHPVGAVNVPWLEPSADGMAPNPLFLQQVEQRFARDAGLVVGCASGVRSLAAAGQLEAHGFSRLVEQRAGMSGVRDPFGRIEERGWLAEGLPLSTTLTSG